jgi:hypothetical protein
MINAFIIKSQTIKEAKDVWGESVLNEVFSITRKVKPKEALEILKIEKKPKHYECLLFIFRELIIKD